MGQPNQKQKKESIYQNREYWYRIEKSDKKVSIDFDTFEDMLEVAKNYEKQDIDYDCYSMKKTPVLLAEYQLKEHQWVSTLNTQFQLQLQDS